MKGVAAVVSLAALLAGVLAFPSGASATVREVAVADPNDAPPVLSGQQDEDVRHVVVKYDEAGSIQVEAAFYSSLNGSKNADLSITVSLAGKAFQYAGGCDSSEGGGATVFLFLKGLAAGATLTVSGFDGSVRVPVSLNGDGTVATATLSHPALAGRDYRCVEVGSLYTSYYEFYWCAFAGCPRKSAVVDTVDRTSWFNGYAPACGDGRDNDRDGKTDAADPDCNGSTVGASEGVPPKPKPKPRNPLSFKYQLKLIRVHPNATPAGTTYYGAKLRIEVLSPSLRTGEKVPYKLCVLRPRDSECHSHTLTPRKVAVWEWRVDPDEGRNRKLTFRVLVKGKVVATKSLRIYESS